MIVKIIIYDNSRILIINYIYGLGSIKLLSKRSHLTLFIVIKYQVDLSVKQSCIFYLSAWSATAIKIADESGDPMLVPFDHVLVDLNQILNVPRAVLQKLLIHWPLLKVRPAVRVSEPFLHRLFPNVDSVGRFVSVQDTVQSWHSDFVNST